MRFLRRILEGRTRRDRFINAAIQKQQNRKPFDTMMEEGRLGRLGHVHRMRKYKMQGKNEICSPRKAWEQQVRGALEDKGMKCDDRRKMALD